MKRNGDIRSFFGKAAKKSAAAALNPTPPPVETVVEEQNREDRAEVEEIADPSPPLVSSPPPPPASKPPVFDINLLPYDPGERLPLKDYHVNDQDAIHREYITKGPCKPYIHDFPIKKDSVFCFICYLFKKGSGLDAFVVDGWDNWNIGNAALIKHSGSKAHKSAQERYIGFIIPKVAIDYHIDKWTDEELHLYKKRLTYSFRCIKFLLLQGLAFRGNDESEESSNRGDFIEPLKFLAGNSDEVNKYVLNNAPVDESSDISHKEQLALCLRFVDKLGSPCEHFIGVVHVDDTMSLSLKEAIKGLLDSNGLSMTRIRGQGYDGASNMKGDIKGLKTLIMKESPSAYYIHCFAHQLQLVLVAVAKGNTNCKTFFDQVSILLNIVGVSCQRHGMLRNARLENVKKSLQCGELDSGSGLNKEMGLPRPGDTRWGSHYKTICSIVTMYSSIHDVLIELGADIAYKDDWTKIHFVLGAFETFEFVFFVHLMYVILGYTNELSECLQRRDQDILNAISLVNVAKSRMQQLMSDGWDKFHKTVTSFCITHGVEVPAMDDAYVPYGN
ncbi:uncharacterized protein [Miscanthus floridulus]|uniref:uncharacterized protein n=1 Tax=Miscanthus floridulus TaxID=154761 RepID=UPI0034594D1B